MIVMLIVKLNIEPHNKIGNEEKDSNCRNDMFSNTFPNVNFCYFPIVILNSVQPCFDVDFSNYI